MTESRAILIRARGRTRVLRLAHDARGVWFLAYAVRDRAALCTRCGCTDRYGCLDGCTWVDLAHTVCTRCAERIAR